MDVHRMRMVRRVGEMPVLHLVEFGLRHGPTGRIVGESINDPGKRSVDGRAVQQEVAGDRDGSERIRRVDDLLPLGEELWNDGVFLAARLRHLELHDIRRAALAPDVAKDDVRADLDAGEVNDDVDALGGRDADGSLGLRALEQAAVRADLDELAPIVQR